MVIDLREKPDFDNGHIVDAKNVPYKSIQSELTQKSTESSGGSFAPYKDKAIILVCKMGQHSSQVAKKLAEQNFNVYRLSGGVMEWQSAQMPLVKS